MSAKKKTTSKKRKTKKSKVYVSPIKAGVLCLFVIALGVMLLLATNISKTPSPVKTDSLPSIAQRFEPESAKTKTEEKKTEKPAQTKPKPTVTETKPKTEPEKTVQPKPQTQGTTQQSNQTSAQTATQTQTQTQTSAKPVATETAKPVQPVQNTTQTQTNKFNFPEAVNHAEICFVFDDGGQNLNHLAKYLELPFPITIAVLPRLTHSAESAKRIRAAGKELILHQPMQSVNSNVNPGPGAITPEMDENDIISTLFININEIAPIAGMNNHEGSAITADAEKMETVLKLASDNGIYFLDSRTNADTKVPYVSKQLGYHYYERNIFLDNEKTRENALAEIRKGLAIANKNGSVIMIGHIWSADFLPALLKEIYPELKAKGYTFSVVSNSRGIK